MSGKVKFYSRQVAQDLIDPHYIISIGESGDHWKLKHPHKSVLRLEFHDISEFLEERYILFSSAQAIEIINWIESIPSNETIIVHCEAGISRSAAVAKFIIDTYNYTLEPDRFCIPDFSLMNTYVYETLIFEYSRLLKK